ncbi:phosphodiester glycosidase family protein [Microlunatus speluncae]|uniref:phosphodiester glycosidase family protein n=1 Tax=Microlunatus speluncae TaxID=2594267 RepID=UPI0012665DE7|nr:phosphodiester glycosidase family protein [Microlunatus speluncae]
MTQRIRGRVLLIALSVLAPLLVVGLAPAAAEPAAGTPAGAIETYQRSRPVAPGVTAEQLETLDARGWQQGNALTIDTTQGARIDYLGNKDLTTLRPITEQADAAGAVAAVNGDFFDINNSGAPLGPAIKDGELIKSQSEDPYRAVGFDADGVGRVLEVLFEGTATLPSGPVALDRLNGPVLKPGEVAAYTSLWGASPRGRAVQGATTVVEVMITDGVVSAVADQAGTGAIPADTTILLGREAGADALRALKPGDEVAVSYRPRPSDGRPLHTAIGVHELLVQDGQARPVDDQEYAGRTGLGFSRDGTKIIIVGVDSDRQTHSRGATLAELGRLLAARGAWVGVELDGGGSTTLVSRLPGAAKVQVDNTPGDGSLRPVPNGLAIMAPKGSGDLAGFWLEPAASPRTAASDSPVAGKARPDRVFSGLSRALTATPHDETYGPAAVGSPVQWSATRGTVRDGVYRATDPGPATITARSGSARGTLQLDVLGRPARLAATAETVNVPSVDATATFGILGYDAFGTSAPIDPADLELSYDRSLFMITPTADGRLRVKPIKGSGAGLVTARIGDLSATLGVSVGVTKQQLATFDDADQWTVGTARATATVSQVPDGEDGAGLKLAYDFGQSTLTRNAYAIPPKPLGVAGQARSFGVSMKGQGKGEWTAFGLYDATGKFTAVYGPYVDWTGWKNVELAVPAGLPQPVTIGRIYTLETKASAQYSGEVLIDNLYVNAAPAVEVPAAPAVRAPIIQTQADVDGRDWRFAVMSDAQFVAREPDSALVQAARRTLREIKAAKPDFFVIAGDFVDEATEADFQLAKKILDEEIGTSVPYYYVPGNHEVMGSAITNFVKYFGDPHRTFDHEGTRFVTLNTSGGTLRSGGFEQLAGLRSELDAAAEDRSISSVVVIEHHPPRDPTPAKNSQLGDRHEAALLEGWLAEFQRSTGKGAAFIGAHVGTFHAATVDNVPYLINGNSGKTPATAPAEGGFTGWSLLGIDEVSRSDQARARRFPYLGGPDWISAQLRPHVDDLTLTAPATLAVGATGTVTATLKQGDRPVPIAYPVSADWRTTANLQLDPETGMIKALRPGPATISVTVNGVIRSATIDLTR